METPDFIQKKKRKKSIIEFAGEIEDDWRYFIHKDNPNNKQDEDRYN